jgi:hypothetical protein
VIGDPLYEGQQQLAICFASPFVLSQPLGERAPQRAGGPSSFTASATCATQLREPVLPGFRLNLVFAAVIVWNNEIS